MKSKSSKLTQVLLDNCENVHIDDSSTVLPSDITASTNLLDSKHDPANTVHKVQMAYLPRVKSQTQDTRVDIEQPLSAERANRALAGMANKPSIFRSPPLPWYSNWTNFGVALCVLYNLTIIILLVMGFYKLRQS